MSNIKQHEPGPWILGGCSGRMITTPSGYVGDGFIADVDTLANARLIAAAPELLGALERLIIAAKPHCVETSQLNMRVKEAELIINNALGHE